ncbi:MAG: FecR domain-containing protein [Rhizobiaceae bacterium]|nr:FecR domain-containing protein [Rhizobiaceae bacterium]
MKYVKPTFWAVTICAFGALQGSAFAAAEPVGSAIKIKQDVIGFGAGGSRDLRVKDAVYRNEEISAGLKSHGELELSDGSKIIVGENSVVLLDDFVVGKGGFKSGTIKVIKGAFRFVTGSSKKGTFTVTTPKATIGVRGTFFDVYIEGGKETVVLFRGEVRVCSTSGCQIARRACDVIEIDPAGNVSKAPFFGSNRANGSERDYNLVTNQRRFSRPLRAPKILCNARAAMEALNPVGNDGLRGNDGNYGPSGAGDVTGSVSSGGASKGGGGGSGSGPSSPTGNSFGQISAN